MRWLGIAVLILALAGVVFLALPKKNDTIRDRLTAFDPEGNSTEALRLAVLGTSLTSNYSWPDEVATLMAECSGRTVQLRRIAEAGVNSNWALDNVERVIAEAPDIVVIEFAINDADLLDGVWYQDSMSNHRELVRLLRESVPEAKIVMMTMSHAHGARGLVRPFLARYYSGYVAVADQTNIDLIDLFPRWLARKRLGLRFSDGLHPDDDVATQVVSEAMSQDVLGKWFPNGFC